jgi:NAD-dependent dihydropyrimidine dehydrogenase PreA subunit
MEPLGLSAYFPALLPDSIPFGSNDRFLKIPDEIALVVYPSQEEYENAIKNSVAGRAYGLLHWPVFNGKDPEIPPSKSGHPEPWAGQLNWDTPCYLAPEAIDWRSGITRLLAARPAHKMSADSFLDQLNDIIRGWLLKRDKNINGSIICACPDYLLYWEHQENDTQEGSLLPLLLDILETPYIHSDAKPVIVPPAFHNPDAGVKISSGDFFDVRVDAYR